MERAFFGPHLQHSSSLLMLATMALDLVDQTERLGHENEILCVIHESSYLPFTETIHSDVYTIKVFNWSLYIF